MVASRLAAIPLVLWVALSTLASEAGQAKRAGAPSAAARSGPVAMIRIEGTVDVPSQEYLERALKVARDEGAQCLLILLNTPGGLGDPMKAMTEDVLNSEVPSIVYVSPAGAFAISAGTYITLSANIAAMHPATTIGAAHPVELLSVPQPEQPTPEEKRGKPAAAPATSVEMQKVVNTFAEQAKAIARERGRNVDWAQQAVRESTVLTAEEALRLHVIDIVARNTNDLLAQVDGRQVRLPDGHQVTLHTLHAQVVEIPPTAKEGFLHVLANPNLLLVLLVLAGMGIMFELQNPGAILPGVIGGLALLLALYSMAVLPVRYAGLGLILFGMLLLLAEVKVPSHGILTVGGIISFVLGALMLTDTSVAPLLRVSWQVIIVMTILVLVFFLFVVGAGVRAHQRKVRTGEEGMLGGKGHALETLRPVGEVMVLGERWRARATEGEIGEGEEIEVVGQDGLTLLVRKRAAGQPKK
jgi:membrane-bound serine protease (ClpP class)